MHLWLYNTPHSISAGNYSLCYSQCGFYGILLPERQRLAPQGAMVWGVLFPGQYCVTVVDANIGAENQNAWPVTSPYAFKQI